MRPISRTAFVSALYGHRSVFLGITRETDFHTALMIARKAVTGEGMSDEYARKCIRKGDGRHRLTFDDGSNLLIDQVGQKFQGEPETGLYIRQVGNGPTVWYWVLD